MIRFLFFGLLLTAAWSPVEAGRSVPDISGTAWIVEGRFESRDKGPLPNSSSSFHSFMIDFLEDGTFVEQGISHSFMLTGTWEQRKKKIIYEYDFLTIRERETDAENVALSLEVDGRGIADSSYYLRSKVKVKLKVDKRTGGMSLRFKQKDKYTYSIRLSGSREWSRDFREVFKGTASGSWIDPHFESVSETVAADLSAINYSCEGVARFNTDPPQAVTGSQRMTVLRPGPISPINGIMTEEWVMFTQAMRIGSTPYTISSSIFQFWDDDGRLWTLGGIDDGEIWWWRDEIDYSHLGIGVVRGRVLEYDPSFPNLPLDAGVISAVGNDGEIFRSESVSRQPLGREILYTILGRIEVRRVEIPVNRVLADGTRVFGTIVQWERPDLGVVKEERILKSEDATASAVLNMTCQISAIEEHDV